MQGFRVARYPAWGAAPANLIPRFIAGVRPLAPGWTKVLIAPQPGPLAHIESRVPTPRGPVETRCERGDGVRLTLKLPPGTTARIILPLAKPAALTLDGRTVELPVLEAVEAGQHEIIAR